jgi:hypothetical protein
MASGHVCPWSAKALIEQFTELLRGGAYVTLPALRVVVGAARCIKLREHPRTNQRGGLNTTVSR